MSERSPIVLGQMLLSQSRYEQAEEQFRRHLADEPDDAEAHVLLASALIGRDERGLACEEAGHAIQLEPEYAEAFSVLSRAELGRNRFSAALEAADRAVVLDPEYAYYRGLKAAALSEMERREEALAAVKEGLAIDPEDHLCTTLHPDILRSLGRLDEADAAVQESLRHNAESANAHHSRGLVLLQRGDARGARAAFAEALRIDPDHGPSRAGLVEAIKGQSRLYRLFLKWTFFVERLSPGARWGLVIGLFALSRVVRVVSRNNPEFGLIGGVILAAYFAFVVFSWLAAPLANTVLRLHRGGRLALSDDQRLGSTLTLIGLATAAAAATWGLASGSGGRMVLAICWILWTLSASAISVCDRGRPRRLAVLMCTGLAVPLVAGTVWPVLLGRIFSVVLLGLIGAQFAMNALVAMKPEK